MIAYNNLEMLQTQISDIIQNLATSTVKSICGNLFYRNTFRYVFNVCGINSTSQYALPVSWLPIKYPAA
jgi:hypothetical protein